MKNLGIVLLFFVFQGDVPWKQAVMEFEKKNYKAASEIFQKYAQEQPLYAAYLSYNAGSAELLRDSLKQAQWLFQQSLITDNHLLKSDAYNNLGVILANQNKNEEALDYWNLALKENPQNEMARYNYELCLRRMQKQDTPPNDASHEKSPKTKKNKKQNFKNQDKGDNQTNIPLGINEVENILNAMENHEKKFIQQLRKRNKSPKLYQGSDW